VIGNGSLLSSITGANVSGTVANATFATSAGTATSATTAGTVTTAAQANITSVGVLTSLSSTGNIDGANITGTHFGSGTGLTSLPGANVTGTVANATFATSAGSATSATTATTAGTVTANAQGNITSVGTLTSLSSSGNITGANINGNGSGLSSITGANVSGAVANATYATSAGSADSANTAGAANSAVYLRDATNASAYVDVNDTFKAVLLPAGGSIGYGGDGVDPNTGGSIDIIPGGNVANAYASLTFVNTANFAANPINTVNVSTSGMRFIYDFASLHGGSKELLLNTTGMSLNTTFSATGNITGGNLRTGGQVSATGNVSGAYIIGNGSQLTNVPDSGFNPFLLAGM
jgi:hypothetical protein